MKHLLLLFIFSCGATLSWAQTRQISGRVISDSTHQPMGGVTVAVKGTKTSTATQSDGRYSIKVPEKGNAVLMFSSIGYAPEEVSVGNRSSIDVGLITTSSTLSDVVVIGYQTVKRKDLLGSVSSVSAKQLKDIPLSSAAEALQGKLAGVQVITSEGGPGADVIIRVRGGGSITQDNSPIYIVDGIQVENALSFLSPQDIATIDVLKDASTTAIYGARGANGVVIITTKSGKPGKTVVTYNGSFGNRQLANTMDVMNPYDFVRWQYERSRRSSTDSASFAQTYGTTWDTLNSYKSIPFVNWQHEVFGRSAKYQSHNVSVSGGSQGTTFNLSVTDNNEEGILLQSGFDRKLLNFKLDHRSDKFRAGVTTRYIDQVIKGAGTTNSGTRTTNRLRHSIQYRPFEISTLPGVDQFDELYYSASNQIQNPVILTEAEYRRGYTKGINMSGYFSYNLLKNLVFKSTGGFDNTYVRTDQFYSKLTPTARNFNSQPVASIGEQTSITITNSNTLNYTLNNLHGHHNFDFLVGEETYETRAKNSSIETRFFPNDITPRKALANMGLGSPPVGSTFTQPRPSSSETPPSRLLSYFGRVTYDMDKRILASFSLRGDRSSKFKYENGILYFPSGSAAWRFTKEKFLEKQTWLSDGKIRVGYGTAGNNRICDVLYLQLYGVTGEYALNHSVIPGFAPTALANQELRWEKTESKNVGLDLAFLKNRVQFTMDIYKNTGKNLLLAVSIPPTTGYTSQLQNVGATSNRGVEFQVNADAVRKKNFSWSSNFNISFNRNKVESLGPVSKLTRSSGWQGSDGIDDYLVKVGQPIGLMYGFINDGYYQIDEFNYNATTGVYTPKPGVAANGVYGTPQPGMLKWRDLNGDGVISSDSDRTVIGNANPKYTGGWNNQFTAFNFDVSVFVNFVVGNDIYNANKIEWTDGAFPNLNTLNIMKNRFTYINDQGQRVTDPTALAALNTNATIWTPVSVQRYWLHSWAIEDGSYLRINNITMGYTIPSSVLKKKLTSVRFYATVNNVATITGYSGYDPDVTVRRSDPLTPGVDFAAYPKARTWVFGLNVTF